jgi:hypothetical protein
MVTISRLIPQRSAKNLINASFAAPSTGGAATATLSTPSDSPRIDVREARG